MFNRKSKTDKVADAATDRTHEAADKAARLRGKAAAAGERAASTMQESASNLSHNVKDSAFYHDVVDKVGPRAGAYAATAATAAATARDRAVSGLDKGIDAAVPRANEALDSVGPKVDKAHDYIVDELLPKLSDWLGSVQDSKNDLLSQQDGAVAVVTGAPKKKKRKGGVLLTLGLLAAAGAGIAWYLNRQQQGPKTDPWADSSGSRPVGGAPGVESQVRDTLGKDAAPAGASTAASAAAAPAAAAPAGEPRMLESDEIDALADDRPLSAEESQVPGTNTDATTGLGEREPTDVLDDIEKGRDAPKGPGLP